jgi:AraC-like DNA-binding protein
LGPAQGRFNRRLNRHGVTYWALFEECCFAIAGALLRETDLKVREIATMIRYGTPGAFTGWAGRSPSVYRSAHATARAADEDGAKWSDDPGGCR